LIAVSATGLLGPIESLLSMPLTVFQGASSGVTHRVTTLVNDATDVQTWNGR
jgi:hypothetical protein